MILVLALMSSRRSFRSYALSLLLLFLQLQLLRLEKNLTQEQMSEKLNLSTSAYCKIEYGETDLTLTRLDKIAKVLGISALSLFSHIDKSMNPNTDNSCSCCPAIFFSFVFILIVFWLIVGVYWVNIIKLVYIRNIKMRLSLLTKKKVI